MANIDGDKYSNYSDVMKKCATGPKRWCDMFKNQDSIRFKLRNPDFRACTLNPWVVKKNLFLKVRGWLINIRRIWKYLYVRIKSLSPANTCLIISLWTFFFFLKWWYKDVGQSVTLSSLLFEFFLVYLSACLLSYQTVKKKKKAKFPGGRIRYQICFGMEITLPLNTDSLEFNIIPPVLKT